MSGKALAGKCEVSPIKGYLERNRLFQKVVTALRMSGDRQLNAVSKDIMPTAVLRNPSEYENLDIVVSETFFEGEEVVTGGQIAAALNSKAWVRNGDVLSFETEGHQVDFILCPPDTIHFNSVLLGNEGFSLLLRYLVKPYNLKLTKAGLFEVIMDGDRPAFDVLISSNWGAISDILGFHYSSYYISHGANSLNDVYYHITLSDTFTLGAFDINEQFDYVGSPACLEYAPFQGFVTYVKEKALNWRDNHQANCPWVLKPTLSKIKRLQKALDKQEYFIERRYAALEDYRTKHLLHAKFNGEVAKVATGLEEEGDLGRFMEAYRRSFLDRSSFEFFIMSSTPDTIRDSMKDFHLQSMQGLPKQQAA